jgi:hypothetical protein
MVIGNETIIARMSNIINLLDRIRKIFVLEAPNTFRIETSLSLPERDNVDNPKSPRHPIIIARKDELVTFLCPAEYVLLPT